MTTRRGEVLELRRVIAAVGFAVVLLERAIEAGRPPRMPTLRRRVDGTEVFGGTFPNGLGVVGPGGPEQRFEREGFRPRLAPDAALGAASPREGDPAFEGQQGFLAFEPPAVSRQAAVGGGDPVTGNEQRDRI